MKYNKILFFIIFFMSCIPPEVDSQTVSNENIELYQNMEDCEPCPLLLNFASSNYSNQDWRSAIDNYNQLLKCNCGKLDPENTYKYMAYSYQQLGLYDSAGYIFKQGLKYTPDDIDLLKMAAENASRLNNYDNQIYYYDKILTIDENNIEILELLSNVYGEQSMYEEQIIILDMWLKIDPGNKDANGDKKAAFVALGKDESDVDKERWESETSNIQYGLEYIKTLKDSDDYEKIIQVCNELIIYEKYNIMVLRNLGDAYLNLYKEDEALVVYKDISKADPTNYEIAMEVSKILINQDKFSEALDWATRAINISGKKGKAFFQRAEVYFAIAENCSSVDPSFWDKVVYEISWEDYTSAANKGYIQAKARRDFVGDNFITTSADWFMRPEEEKTVKPEGECYSWIERSIERK